MMLIHRVILTLVSPVLLGLAFRGGFRAGLERLGFGSGRPGAIWIHGASNGELIQARRIIEALPKPLVVTANTLTARDMVAGWGLDGVTARLAPLDFRWSLWLFRRAWRPRGLVSLENELWPNRIATCGPVVAVAARISERSARRWARFAPQIFARVAYLFPQDATSGERFVALGLRRDRLGPVVDLKSQVNLPKPDPELLAAFQEHYPRAKTWLAASTHPGEEEIVLDAALQNPEMSLILAPRHPRRRSEIIKLIEARGLSYATRSNGQIVGAQVFLADSMGEMSLWYSLARITFVGGSLVNQGGHTPYEPLAFGSGVLHGPYIGNFEDVYRAKKNQVKRVNNGSELSLRLKVEPETATVLEPNTYDKIPELVQTIQHFMKF